MFLHSIRACKISLLPSNWRYLLSNCKLIEIYFITGINLKSDYYRKTQKINLYYEIFGINLEVIFPTVDTLCLR